ncbi:MAG: RNA polymerase sigma factor, partial [Limisphaerales bacterium]
MKRGAGQHFESLDSGTDTSPGLQLSDPAAPNPEREFDRKWALTMLERALGRLTKEQEANGRSGQFEVLKPWLTGEIQDISQAELGRQLGLNENAVKVAIHRLRRRLREVIKSEISQTLADPAQVDEELHHLLE